MNASQNLRASVETALDDLSTFESKQEKLHASIESHEIRLHYLKEKHESALTSMRRTTTKMAEINSQIASKRLAIEQHRSTNANISTSSTTTTNGSHENDDSIEVCVHEMRDTIEKKLKTVAGYFQNDSNDAQQLKIINASVVKLDDMETMLQIVNADFLDAVNQHQRDAAEKQSEQKQAVSRLVKKQSELDALKQHLKRLETQLRASEIERRDTRLATEQKKSEQLIERSTALEKQLSVAKTQHR